MKTIIPILALASCSVPTPGPTIDQFYVDPIGVHTTIPGVPDQPTARWLSSNYAGYTPTATEGYVNEWVTAASNTNSWPILVVYDIPQRDCSGGWSAGGSPTVQHYMDFLDAVTRGINNRRSIVIIEPDALPDLDCLTPDKQGERMWMIDQAIQKIKTENNKVYLDAGNPLWNCAECIAWRLNNSGIAKSDGFSVNVNVYHDVPSSIAYGQAISPLVGNKSFVIDTGRAGIQQNEWCNPTGAALGPVPQFDPINNVDAYLWITPVGQSDGDCGRGEPPAGQWWPERALDLARRAGY